MATTLQIVFSGTVSVVSDIKVFSDKFSKKTIVVDVPGERGNMPMAIDFANNSINLVEDVNEGDVVTVRASVTGRAWEKEPGDTRYFIGLDGLKVRVDVKGEELPSTDAPF